MEDEEHEVYGQEIPVDGEDVDMGAGGDDAAKLHELDEMKRRLKEMEEEAAALREMQAKVAKEMQGGDPNATTSEAKEEMDSRVTILTDKFGQPKGFAYVEFVEAEAIAEAVKLSESELHGRQIKVAPKRTNVPGLKQPRGGRGYSPYGGHPYMRPYPPPFFNPYGGYGRAPRFRRPRRPFY